MPKTALITGAASGLGYEFAKLLAKKQYNLVLVDIDECNLDVVKEELSQQYNVEVQTLIKDLSLPNVAQTIKGDLADKPIDVLINNAGFGVFGRFSETDWKRESDMLHLHVVTVTHLTKLVLKDMIARGSGKIMNVSSVAAFQPGPLMAIYYASKAYMLSFSEAIANELKGSGVTVTALCPGPVDTSFQKSVEKHISNKDSRHKIGFNMGTASEVAYYGYHAMMKGTSVAIPGTINKFLALIHRFVSRNIATKIVRFIQEKNRTV